MPGIESRDVGGEILRDRQLRLSYSQHDTAGQFIAAVIAMVGVIGAREQLPPSRPDPAPHRALC
jgi:hypothetical protein